MKAQKVNENLNKILKGKTPQELIHDLFAGTELECVDPETECSITTNSYIVENGGEDFLRKKGIKFTRVSRHEYILQATLLQFVNYFIELGWSPAELREYLDEKLKIK